MELKAVQDERLDIRVNLRFPKKFIEEVEAVAARYGLTQVQVIRFATLAGLPLIADGKMLPVNGNGEKKIA